jgi:hypothetical protein
MKQFFTESFKLKIYLYISINHVNFFMISYHMRIFIRVSYADVCQFNVEVLVYRMQSSTYAEIVTNH